jgi:hypothetical protein
MSALHFRARPERHPSHIQSEVTMQNGITVTSSVENLSADGCCIEGSYRIGEMVTIELPNIGTFRAKVRWAVLGRAGLRFHREGLK